MKKAIQLRKGLCTLLGFFCLSTFTSFPSQCFAQSGDEQEQKKGVASKKQISEYINNIYYAMEVLNQCYVDDLDMEQIYKGAMKGLLDAAGDVYTAYLDTTAMRGLNDTTEGTFGGVGLSISKAFESTDEKPAYVEVVAPIEDTPGFKAGIQPGDLIVTVDGTDTSTITMDDVLDKLRGTIGENVTVGIRRGGADFDIVLTRAEIEVPTVKFGTIPLDSKTEIGYMRLIEFTPLTATKVQEALDSFDYGKTKGIIIDLRNNPGGPISSVHAVADKFIDEGPIVSTKGRVKSENNVYSASKEKTTFKAGIPIVVLINKGSASASEILSGALKDNHLAYLVGQRTYGKGLVQQVWQLSKTEGFKYTVARYYTPSDVCIDKIGIPPDREILFPELSEEGAKQYAELYKSGEISKYVESNRKSFEKNEEKQIKSFSKSLKKSYPEIDEPTLRKMIRNEVRKSKGSMLYDLDYDIQLIEAIKILDKEDFSSLVKNAKTLKELQDSALLEEKKEPEGKKDKK